MTRDEVLRRLRAHENELRAAGLASLYLFGSTARGDARDESDVDLLCELDDRHDLGLFEFFGLQDRLADLLSSKVDLVDRRYLRPRVRARVEPEMLRVY